MSRNVFLETDGISEVLVNTVQISTHNAGQPFGKFVKMVECSFMN